jgi:hypothetical protein
MKIRFNGSAELLDEIQKLIVFYTKTRRPSHSNKLVSQISCSKTVHIIILSSGSVSNTTLPY